jgi:hypothetical protein
MSISGSLSDIAIVDLLQFVHMSQRSGTLLLERRGETAHISFHRGRIASAWGPSSPSVAHCLLEQGRLSAEQLQRAAERRRTATTPLSLGQALLEQGDISWPELRDAVAVKVERTIFGLVGWNEGSFRLLADEVRADDEISFAPGDVLPNVEIDTQGILLEAVRLFDERSQKGAPVESPQQDSATMRAADSAATSLTRKARARVQVLSKRADVVPLLQGALGELAVVTLVDARDAGAPGPGEPQPLVVIDLRAGDTKGHLRRIRELHARAMIVGLVASADGMASAFADGAVAAAEASYLPACCANLLRAHTPADAGDGNLRSGLSRRAVLFVQQGEQLVALGAFGATRAGLQLASATRGLNLRAEAATTLSRCIVEGRALTLDYDTADVPEELKRVLDRPRSGQGVLFPVLGARRAIGLIYADNGRRAASVQDVELMELATAQVGLAFENELLRRQLERMDRVVA